MKKINKFKKTLSTFFATFGFISSGLHTFGMENNDDNDKIIKYLQNNGTVNGQGMSLMYHCNEYPELILKTTNFSSIEFNIATKLQGKRLSENLMFVKYVPDNRNFLYEYIKGLNLEKWIDCYKGVLKLDFFIEKWCFGLFNAMETFKNEVGGYKGDMKKENIIIKNTPNGPIPVLIDFGFTDDESVGDLASILLEVMKKFVKGDDKKINMLSKYLIEIISGKKRCFDISMIDTNKSCEKSA